MGILIRSHVAINPTKTAPRAYHREDTSASNRTANVTRWPRGIAYDSVGGKHIVPGGQQAGTSLTKEAAWLANVERHALAEQIADACPGGRSAPIPAPRTILPTFPHHIFVGSMGTMGSMGPDRPDPPTLKR
jgi:hypothetical protein